MKQTSLTHGTLYLTVSTFVFVISSYLLNIWLGRFLGPAAYGIYGIIISLMTVINLMQTTGLPLAVAKYIAENESNADSILKSALKLQLVSTVAASLLFFLFSDLIATLLNDHRLLPYIRATAVIFPIYGIFSIYMNYYNGLHFFKTQALMNIVYSLAKLVSIFFLVLLFKVYGIMIGFIISPLISLIIFFHFPKSAAINFPFKPLIMFSIPLIAIAIFTNLLQSVDLFFIKSLLHSDKLTGIYTANQNIAELPFYGITAIASVLFPSIARSMGNKDYEQAKRLISNSIRISLIILTPSIILISATSSKILTFLYSTSYHTGAESLSILVIGSGFFTLFIILTTILSSSGSPYLSTSLAGGGLLLTALLCALLVPSLGLIGGALSTTITTTFVATIAGILLYRKFKTFTSLKSIFNVLVSSLLILLLAKIFTFAPLALPVFYLVLFAIYGVCLFVLKEFNSNDFLMIKSLIPNIFLKKLK